MSTQTVSGADKQQFPGVPIDLPRRKRHVLLGKILSAVLLLAMLGVVISMVGNPAFEWNVVGEYLFHPLILKGAGTTLALTFWSVILSVVLAVILAVMALSKHLVVRGIAKFYVWFFRSIPLLVLLIIWFNIAIVIPRIVIGVPFGPEFWSIDTSAVVDAFWAAVLAFGMQQAAYMSEVIRAALLAVPPGQREAATALGMHRVQRFGLIELPQAVRIAVPPIANDVIGVLKGTSLAAFVAVPDLLYSAQAIYNRTYEVFPLLIVVTAWYIVFVTILTFAQHRIEKRLREGKRGRALAVLADIEGGKQQ